MLHDELPGVLLARTDAAWRVLQDYADIFLIERNGPRRHILRIEAGGVFTGLGSAADDAWRAVVIPGLAAEILPLTTQPLTPEELAGWVLALSSSMQVQRPARALELSPNETSALDRRAASSSAGVVWVSPRTAPAYFLGDRTFAAIPPNEWFPVTPVTWLEPVESTEFEARASDASSLANYAPFFSYVLYRWARLAEEDEARHARRAERQREANRARIGEAVADLAAALNNGEEQAIAGGDPALACLRQIGHASNIEFRTPHDDATGDNGENSALNVTRISGVPSRKVLLSAAWWKQDHGALLGKLSADASPVALIPAGSGYRIFYPADATGPPRWQRVDADVAAMLDPFALSFYRPLPPGPASGRTILQFAFYDCAAELRAVLAISVVSAMVTLTVPVVTGIVFDHILPQAERSQLALAAGVLFVAAVAAFLFNLTRDAIILRVEGRIDARLQAALWARLLDLPASFSRRFSAGDLAMRGLGIQAIREALTGAATHALLTGVFSLISFALLFTYSPQLALAALGLVGIATAATVVSGLLELRYQRQLAAIAGELSGLTLNIVNGVGKIRIAAAESRAFYTWSRRYSGQVRAELAGRRIRSWLASFNALWAPLCTAVLFFLYLGQVRKAMLPGASAPMTPGDLVAFLSAFSIVLTAIIGLASAMMDLIAVSPAYERAKPILEAQPEEILTQSQPGALTGAIELRNIMFRYAPELPPVLRNVSISIRAGEFIAVVGSSGSGKSTLMRLLLGFEAPESGTVFYDGRDLRILDARAVRRQAGVVLQNGRIAAGSLFTNIVGATSLTMDDAWEAARMAGLDADIEAMPMGMHTVLGEGGGTLSGGQRQRLLIARALVRRPRILFFDEATSALDNATQATVSRALDRLSATRVVIAHRLSTIERADRIFVLDKGVLVEEGNFQQLLAQNGVFAELARRQMT